MTVNLRMPVKLYDRYCERALALDQPITTVMRLALRRYLLDHPTAGPPTVGDVVDTLEEIVALWKPAAEQKAQSS